ncbi:MAG: SDR family NAD(P)-dependent oxidoreductase, partial [Propionibacteriaceae bacterium]
MLTVPQVDTSDLTVRLDGQVAVVTGGASGIGRAIAERYVASGAQVVLADRDLAAAEQAAGELAGSVTSLECDVTSTASVSGVVDQVLARHDQIDILVNSAGIALLAPAEDLEDAQWDATLAVNLGGTYRMCRAVGTQMLARGRGRIINLASQAATVALPDHVAYCASKSGVLGLTRVLALEWGGRGVTVNTISPTVVLTPLGLGAWDNPRGEA